MKDFALGFITAVVFIKNVPRINRFLDRQLAKLELKRDLLLHDHPELRDN